jgi:hypothetical protein
MPENISIVPITKSSCQPFLLEVMVFSPEAGFKFEVSIERSCKKPTETEPAKAVFKLVFDLFKQKKNSDEFDQIVHVSYTGETDVQQKKIESMAANGVNTAQSKQLITRVHPAAKGAADIGNLPEKEAEKLKTKVKKEMSKTVDLAFD